MAVSPRQREVEHLERQLRRRGMRARIVYRPYAEHHERWLAVDLGDGVLAAEGGARGAGLTPTAAHDALVLDAQDKGRLDPQDIDEELLVEQIADTLVDHAEGLALAALAGLLKAPTDLVESLLTGLEDQGMVLRDGDTWTLG